MKLNAAEVLKAPSKPVFPVTFTGGGAPIRLAPETKRISPALARDSDANPLQPLMPRTSIKFAVTASVAEPEVGFRTAGAFGLANEPPK